MAKDRSLLCRAAHRKIGSVRHNPNEVDLNEVLKIIAELNVDGLDQEYLNSASTHIREALRILQGCDGDLQQHLRTALNHLENISFFDEETDVASAVAGPSGEYECNIELSGAEDAFQIIYF